MIYSMRCDFRYHLSGKQSEISTLKLFVVKKTISIKPEFLTQIRLLSLADTLKDDIGE